MGGDVQRGRLFVPPSGAATGLRDLDHTARIPLAKNQPDLFPKE
jgi:hypothetical protein